MLASRHFIKIDGKYAHECHSIERYNKIVGLERDGFDGIVYVPEYSTWKPKADYVDQAMWERVALTKSTVIMFWIPRQLPDMPAFTTNVEFGYWLHTGKVVYGRPNDARKIKYLDWLYELDYGKKPVSTLEKTLDDSISFINKLNII